MATTYTVELAEGGKPIVFTGPEDASEEHILYTAHLMLQERNQEQQPDPSTIASRALGMADAGLSFASGAANTVAGGIAGAVATPFAGAETGANIVNAFTNTIREPATPEGQKTLADAGVAIKSIIDQLNVPLASVGSFIEIMTGQGLDKAVETFSRVKEEGAGIVAGDRVLEETGSPLLATAARITPEAIMEVVGAKGLTGARGLNKGLSVDDVVDPRVAPVVRQGSNPVISGVKNTVIDVFEYQSPSKKKVAELIKEGSTKKSTAGFRLSESLRKGKNIVVDDKVANSAIQQGFDEGTVALIKGSSPTDRAKMLKMLDKKWESMGDKSVRARASQVVGDTVMERYETVYNAKELAGKRINLESKKLVNKPSGAEEPFDQFKSDLEEAGVEFDADGKPEYTYSDFEDFDTDQKLLNTILRRIYRNPTPDAREAHKLKRFIDAKVSFGKKSPGGLEGTAENILKDLRRRIDEQLDAKYENYNEANTTYKDTRDALEAFQKVAGQKMNLDSPSAEKAVGILMRRLLSNAPSRTNLMDAIDGLEESARKNGGKFDDDYYAQTVFIDELEGMFGADGGTSLYGQMSKSINLRDVPMTQEGAMIKGAEKAIEMINPRNPKEAIKAMRALLENN